MSAADRKGPPVEMQAPVWNYQAPYQVAGGHGCLYRKVELMSSPGELGITLRRRDGSNRASLQTTLYLAHGTVHHEVYLTPQRAIALRDALNDYLADLRQEALA